MKIKDARATYTGGGIYVYTGQLDTGEYFVGSDGWCLEVMDEDVFANWEESMDGCEWMDLHRVRVMSEDDTYEAMSQVLAMAVMLDRDRHSRLEKIRNKTWIWK